MMFEESADDPSLKSFLEDVALVSDIDNYESTANAVTLMTIHSAKGLEFETVFLPGFEEGVFPSQQVMFGSEKEMEEERRLAYVAVTRAKKQLIITYANTRLLYGKTSSNPLSRFATEIPKECVTIEQPVKAPFCNNVSESKRKFVKSRDSFIRNTSSVSARQDAAETPCETLNIAVGDKVSHFTFGEGVVTTVLELSGGDALYGIKFSDGTVRKLMGKFAKLKKL
ncbi:MAG: ATP-binding domain-containing protein [Clostridia bacterium]|nr:ATP-binding domain-containing protein [Clostridia bacterium]